MSDVKDEKTVNADAAPKEESKENNLTAQLERRKRINRMKKGILTFLFAWILIVSFVMVFLFVRVLQLQKQVSILAANQIEISQLAPEASVVPEETYVESTEASPAPVASAAPTVEIASADESNLAQPGDTLKVYLTFDDGPSSNTDEILDILDQYGVKATFFVIGKEDPEAQEAYKRIAEEGHTLGMHSYSHQYSLIYNSLEDFEADFTKLQSYLYDLTGVESQFYRFPGSSSNQISNTDMGEFFEYLDEVGVTYFDWNVSSGDATNQAYTKEEIVNNVLNDVVKYKTSVVLLHDSDAKGTTVEALAPLIEGLQSIGAEILPIDSDTTKIQYAVLEKNVDQTISEETVDDGLSTTTDGQEEEQVEVEE